MPILLTFASTKKFLQEKAVEATKQEKERKRKKGRKNLSPRNRNLFASTGTDGYIARL
jgi:hypothetical protein